MFKRNTNKIDYFFVFVRFFLLLCVLLQAVLLFFYLKKKKGSRLGYRSSLLKRDF